MFAFVHSEEEFSAQNFNNISTDPYINHSVIVSGGTNKNPAGPHHLDALLDHDTLFGPRNSMLNHPCGAATRCRTGGGVLSIVKKHPRVNACRGVNSLAGNAETKSSVRLL
jgi:hypothetical protein